MLRRAVQRLVGSSVALFLSHGCGARSTLDLGPSVDESRPTSTGGASLASGGATGAGGEGDEGPTGGTSTGGTADSGGSTFVSGGTGMGGAMMGMGGAEPAAICDDPAFECKNGRSAWLMFGFWNMRVTAPEEARCVDYNDDNWVDFLDYLALGDVWREGCPPIGPQEPAGTCSFYGDVNQNRCLDLEDYELIRAQEGLSGAEASPCSDVDRSGSVDVVDLGYLLAKMDTAGCPDEVLDPTIAIDGYTGEAQSCNGASLGDINQDGEVDVRDLSRVLATLDLTVTEANLCMDVDRSGTIDLADALHIHSRYPPNTRAATCQDTMDQLEAAVDGGKTCTTDDDCQIVDVDCSHVAEHCSQVVYVNRSMDVAELNALAREVSDCIDIGNDCPACDEPSPNSACVMGRCQSAQSLFPL